MKLDSKNSQSDVDVFKNFSITYSPMIDRTIKEFFKNKKENAEYPFIAELYLSLEEFCLRDGKRIRPLLLLISYFGYCQGKKNDEGILLIASILEMIHSLFLIQDDIIDRSEIRRGGKALHILLYEKYIRLTNNRNIGNDIALVLSDVLFSNAIEIISNAEFSPQAKNEFLRIFSKTYELTSWGQILDSMHSLSKTMDIDESVATQISTLKTAHYTMSGPMLMGSVLAGVEDKNEEDKIKSFTLPLGLAFQVRDDILGVFGNKEKIGKSSDSDIIEGKQTHLIENTMKNLSNTERKEFIFSLTKEKKTKKEIEDIKNIIKVSGGLEISKGRLKELIDLSRENLLRINISDKYRRILSGLIDSVKKI